MKPRWKAIAGSLGAGLVLVTAGYLFSIPRCNGRSVYAWIRAATDPSSEDFVPGVRALEKLGPRAVPYIAGALEPSALPASDWYMKWHARMPRRVQNLFPIHAKTHIGLCSVLEHLGPKGRAAEPVLRRMVFADLAKSTNNAPAGWVFESTTFRTWMQVAKRDKEWLSRIFEISAIVTPFTAAFQIDWKRLEIPGDLDLVRELVRYASREEYSPREFWGFEASPAWAALRVSTNTTVVSSPGGVVGIAIVNQTQTIGNSMYARRSSTYPLASHLAGCVRNLSPEAERYLVQRVQDDPRLRLVALEILVSANRQLELCREELLKCLTTAPSLGQFAWACRILEKSRTTRGACAPTLAPFLQHADPFFRLMAAEATLKTRDPSASKAIWDAMLGANDALVRQFAIMTLYDEGREAVDALPSVLERIDSLPAGEQIVCFRVLGWMGPGGKDALPVLRKYSRNRSEEVAEAASDAVRRLEAESL